MTEVSNDVGEPVDVLGVIPGPHTMETLVHAELAADRRDGEWFADSPALRSLIDREAAPWEDEARWRELWVRYKSTPNVRWLTCTAFGETKTLREWAKDPRCLISSRTLRYRLEKGWEPVLSLTTPALRQGEAWDRRAGVRLV